MSNPDFNSTRRCVLGLGCERGADGDEVLALALQALGMADIVPEQLAGIASIDGRREEPAILGVADRFGVAAVFFDAETLERETPRVKYPSAVVFARVGCHGVAESAAMAAVGPAAELVLPKIKSAHATAAIARILLQKQ